MDRWLFSEQEAAGNVFLKVEGGQNLRKRVSSSLQTIQH